MKKWRFLGLFLASFAGLLVAWYASHAGPYYTAAMLRTASVVGPVIHGWVLEIPEGTSDAPDWVHGSEKVKLRIQFDQLAIGVVPLLALLAATPAAHWRRRLGRMALGALLYFAVDTIIVALFPLLVFYKNDFTDVIGTFLGLVAFVGAPAIIWFALTFRELQGWLPLLRPRSVPSR